MSSKKIKRRDFLTKTSLLAGATGLSLPNIARAQSKRRLKMVTTWPKNFPGFGTSCEALARRVKLMSKGSLEIKIYAAGELVGAFEAYDAVSTGAADMYHAAEYYWQGKSPAFNFFTAVPFGMTPQEINAWIYWGGGQTLWDELSSRFNIRSFLCGNSGMQMGGWFNREINRIEDFRGLKIRIPGLGGELLHRHGALAVSLPGGEIFPSMKSGAIDATEWVGPWNDLAFGLYQVAKFYYWPGFHEPGPAISAGINLESWQSLSTEHQEILRTAMEAENNKMYTEYEYRNAVSLKILTEKHNVKLRRFSPEILKTLKKTSEEILEEIGSHDNISHKIYKSFRENMARSKEWTKISSIAYYQTRDGE
ncbi:MAG: TRAP transporter substrate-binding protein [Parvibaculales bacterium]